MDSFERLLQDLYICIIYILIYIPLTLYEKRRSRNLIFLTRELRNREPEASPPQEERKKMKIEEEREKEKKIGPYQRSFDDLSSFLRFFCAKNS